jgi:uridine kinase
MKIAILLSGYLRTINNNISHIEKFIIQNNEVDFFIHYTFNEKQDKYYNPKVMSLNKLIEKLTPKVLVCSDNLNFHSDEKVNNLMNQNYKFYWLKNELNKICENEKINYDIIVKIRPDILIEERLDYNECLSLNKIIIPSKDMVSSTIECKTTCDIISYGPSEEMKKMLDFHIYTKNYNSYLNEKLLYNYLNENEINYKMKDIKYKVVLSSCNVISITGDSGSGKSILSDIIKDCFDNSFTLECDRYHKWERNDDEWKNYTHLNPEANFITKMQNDVFDLKIGKNIYQVDYNHETGKFTDNKLIESSDNIIVCGLHSQYIKSDLLDLKVFMDTDENLRIPWKIKRDKQKRSKTIEEIYTQILDRKEDYLLYIEKQKSEADIIICFYTDYKFNKSTFEIDDKIDIYLKVGLKNFDNFIKDTKFVKNIKFENKYMYIYFNDYNDYKEIIKLILKCS